jgi:hypothetical protein
LINVYSESALISQFNERNKRERKILVDSIMNKSTTTDCQVIFSDQRVFCDQFYDYIQYYKWDQYYLTKLKIYEMKLIDDRYLHWMSYENKPKIKITMNDGDIDLYRGSFGETEVVRSIDSKRNNVKFNLRSFHLLESPYSTDCRYYDKSSEKNEQKSEQRCYLKCITDLETKSKCSKDGYLLADQFISKKLNFSRRCLDLKNDISLEKKIEICRHDCKPECHLNYYDFYVDPIEDTNSAYKNLSIMNIFPLDRAYLSYIYTPKMDVDQLVYNIGGILSLWFGFSAFSFINSLIECFKNF